MAEPSDARDRFFDLVDRWIAEPHRRTDLTTEIEAAFGDEKAVVACDMCGFTRIVRDHGTVHYIAMIRRMQRISNASMTECGGRIVKFDADNLTAVFSTVDDAVDGVGRLFAQVADDNRRHDPTLRIRLSLGIAYGKILDVPGYDVNGDPINVSYKLGEDLADDDEVILHQSAYDRLTLPVRDHLSREVFTVSGVEIPAYRLAASRLIGPWAMT